MHVQVCAVINQVTCVGDLTLESVCDLSVCVWAPSMEETC